MLLYGMQLGVSYLTSLIFATYLELSLEVWGESFLFSSCI